MLHTSRTLDSRARPLWLSIVLSQVPRSVLLLCGMMLGFGCGGESQDCVLSGSCESGNRGRTGGMLDDPGAFSFPKVNFGASAEARVTLLNTGRRPVEITNVMFSANTDVRDFQLYWSSDIEFDERQNPAIIDGQAREGLQDVIDIAPDESITLVLIYTRANTEYPSGSLLMTTTAENYNRLQIPILGRAGRAELVVVPDYVDMGRVAIGETSRFDVQVSNVGVENGLIEQLTVLGTRDFSLEVDGQDPRVHPEVLDDPDNDGEPGLATSRSFVVTVVFTATSERTDRGELSIRSDAVNPDLRINLVANGSSPCLEVVPTERAFGGRSIGIEHQSVVTIESCGADNVEIRSIEVTAGGDAFSIPEGGLPEPLPGLLAAADLSEDPPFRPSINLPLVFTPTEERAYSGTLVIESNDPQQPVIEVPLTGRGASIECPVAQIREPERSVLPLAIVELDGSESIDTDGPDRRPVDYQWVVVERPDGSTAVPVERFSDPLRPAEGGPEDQTSTPNAVFFVDLAGTYVLELIVTDSDGASSEQCPQAVARMVINSNPDEDIHLQLVWDTPGDDDQTDLDGSDVDLHFQHPSGIDWFRDGGQYDCYFGNPTPDWGQIGFSDDNPSLDIDDTNGAGPENINLDSPENTQTLGGPYRVAVHYYRASVGPFGGAETYGPSDVTLRIYLGGVLTREFTRRLDDTNDFWEVAGIFWTDNDRRVVEIDQVSSRLP